MYIQGSAIDKKFKGSLEHQASVIREAIEGFFGDSPVNVIATHLDHSFAMDPDGKVLKISYDMNKGQVENIKATPSKAIPVIEDDDVPRFVSDQLRLLVKAMATGKKVSRTQVREAVQLVDKEEPYWISDILDKIDEATDASDWFGMYEANQEQVRTTLYGKIREIESPFPATRFSKITKAKLSQFEEELREGLTILASLVGEMVDECSQMVFDQDQDDFFSAICESLRVEAQAICGLLGKAEKLMRTEDMERMAVAHDRLAERAKTMAVVTAYMATKSQPNQNEE